MNRRGFLQLLGAGLPAAVVCEKVGLLERVRTYFFAPQMGWNRGPLGYIDGIPYFVSDSSTGVWHGLNRSVLTYPEVAALQLEKLRVELPTIFKNDQALFDLIAQDRPGRLVAVQRMPYILP